MNTYLRIFVTEKKSAYEAKRTLSRLTRQVVVQTGPDSYKTVSNHAIVTSKQGPETQSVGSLAGYTSKMGG